MVKKTTEFSVPGSSAPRVDQRLGTASAATSVNRRPGTIGLVHALAPAVRDEPSLNRFRKTPKSLARNGFALLCQIVRVLYLARPNSNPRDIFQDYQSRLASKYQRLVRCFNSRACRAFVTKFANVLEPLLIWVDVLYDSQPEDPAWGLSLP